MISPTRLTSLVFAAAFAVVAISATPAQAVIVDDFNVTTFPPTVLPAPGMFMHADVGVPGVVGGDRTTTLTATAATSMVNSVGFEISGGQAFYASGPSADGSVSLFYNGATLAADLGAALTSVIVSFASFDDGFNLGMDVTVTVTDNMANVADLTQSIVSSMTDFDMVFLLENFNNVGSVDLENLVSILVDFEPNQGQDFILNSITATVVPEPASIAVWGMIAFIGAAVGGYRRWRRGPWHIFRKNVVFDCNANWPKK